MIKLIKAKPFTGFKATPILATLTVIFGLCLALDHSASMTENSNIICNSNVYRVGYGFEQSQRLEITSTADGVQASIGFYDGDTLTNKITASGTVEQIQAPILTYAVELSRGQHSKGLLQQEPSQTMQEAIMLARYMVEDNHSEPFLIKVLEMNKAAGVATIQIEPGNSLWVCKFK
ncbi:hypothetical protein AB4298_09695 [Shewanella sp. 10N.261.52.F9]|uniref:hypothetical protein n=1 Tax=Shewanella TaxID=22 RepID=UPI00200BA5F4|nr:hypothetical protein [Shewanella marinintestina]MCL1145152.1 hypothetical protein [Shewanella marinintestina]